MSAKRLTLAAVGIDSPLAEGGSVSPPARKPATAKRPNTTTPAKPRKAAAEQTAAAPDPYAGVPKVAVNMRMLQLLWEDIELGVRSVEELGLKTSRTEVVEALLHRDLPRKPAELAELVRSFRRARAG